MSQTSRGYLLDALESIANLVALSSHYKELIQDLTQTHELSGDETVLDKIEQIKSLLSESVALRRDMMSQLEEEFKAQKDQWCAVKHVLASYITAWEVYDATKDPKWAQIALRATDLMSKEVGLWLGIDGELESCMRCMADRLATS